MPQGTPIPRRLVVARRERHPPNEIRGNAETGGAHAIIAHVEEAMPALRGETHMVADDA